MSTDSIRKQQPFFPLISCDEKGCSNAASWGGLIGMHWGWKCEDHKPKEET